jgi:hypothetical protein
MIELFLPGMIYAVMSLKPREEEDFLEEENQLHHLRVKLTLT